MNLKRELDRRITEALVAAGAPDRAQALVSPSARSQFGHYQANGVMAAAKKLKTDPRELAEKVIAAADLSDMAEPPEVAGPGFINIRLKPKWLAGQLDKAVRDNRLGVGRPDKKQTVVVDYSGPNLAKEMHVGHLRSTVIGDALARVLEFVGHDVIRQNHVGDWGTQFGMLVAYMESLGDREGSGLSAELADLEEFYRKAKERFDADAGFADKAREYVVRLQVKKDKNARRAWERFVEQSLEHCEQVYRRLGVLLIGSDVRGESFYNDKLPSVVEDLDTAGMLVESQGAKCVFLDEFKGKGSDGTDLPVIVQKSDCGYLYATTDLAALRYRCDELKANRILYVTDSRQAMHFAQIFAVAREAGFVGKDVRLKHVPLGMMLGGDGRPFRTREGGTVRLMDLLDEAEQRAFKLVSEKNPDLNEAQRSQVARIVGISAVKYADLSRNRTSDYVFSWDKMLSLEGNTAPYMQYAYARVRSIFRKEGLDETAAEGGVVLGEPAEMDLAVKLGQFPETVQAVADECLPNLLCGYLFDLAGAFMTFYESCPVLKAPDKARRTGRLRLCLLTAKTVRSGLELLGIETLEQM
ncbi:MAG: arginine--tRNA ligase [Phycisphaerae bacterium]|jgi:arginyl-tRNA synthetase|nr:arginine--tRNA ligase [Phycisphaerae bacterium]